MYSRLPMPTLEWKEENRRYSLCFFWLVGAVIGVCITLWFYLSSMLEIGQLLFSAVSALIPVLITGGIHLDGFCDVSDAKASCASRERRLEIMSDPRIGAFAAISLSAYMLLTLGLFGEITKPRHILIISLGFVVSRTLSAFAAVTFRSAKSNGSLQSFVKPVHKKITFTILVCVFVVTAAAMLLLDAAAGAAALSAALLVLLYYRLFSYRSFGGITGDLAGYFLQLCEISMLAAVVAADKITGVIV